MGNGLWVMGKTKNQGTLFIFTPSFRPPPERQMEKAGMTDGESWKDELQDERQPGFEMRDSPVSNHCLIKKAVLKADYPGQQLRFTHYPHLSKINFEGETPNR